MSATPIYNLEFFIPNLLVGNNLDLDKNRFITIESQLYNIYNIFGNGIVDQYDPSGALVPTWIISQIPNTKNIQISSGVGHIGYVYAKTISATTVSLILPPGSVTGNFIYYIYATQTATTPLDQSVNFVATLVQNTDTVNYIGLGGVVLTLNSDGTFSMVVYNTAAYGRQEISILSSLSSLVKNHVHTGGPSEPSPIDLGKHVTGFLSSDNISDLNANTITSGTLDPNRLPIIDHNSLLNIGTLTHTQIDALLAALQYPDNNYSLSDYGIVNRIQIILALKRQSGFLNIDGEQYNSVFYLPYSNLSGFVDTVSTTATVDTNIHRVYGVTGIPRQSNVLKINTAQDFQTALFVAEDSITYPSVSNLIVSGISTISALGSITNPYGMAGSASTIYVSSAVDSFVSSFSTTGQYLKRRNDFDQFLPLNSPLGLWYDGSANYLYIADTFNHRIIITDGNLQNTIYKLGANNGSGLPGSNYGQFNFPKGVYGLGNTFYVSDSGNNRVQKFNWSGGIPVFVSSYSFNNYSNTTISGINYSLNDPRGLIATSFNGSNFLFVADYGNQEVLCGIETGGIYAVYQILGQNSLGLGISNTSFISYSPSATASGSSAVFSFSTSVNKTVSLIGVSSSGKNHVSGDTYIFNYPGQPSGLIYILANSLGGVTTAYAQYGISTNNILGFSHPQGLAFSGLGSSMSLIISDTDNNRLSKYTASIGVGTTSNMFLYSYGLGTVGQAPDTSNIVYLARPAGIFSQTGFSTIYIANSLNNRIDYVTAGFSTNILLGYGATSFGVGDTSLTSGGITLNVPFKYVGLASTFSPGTLPQNWFFGETINQGTTNQSDTISRYNFTIFSSQSLVGADTIAIALSTINEQFPTNNLGQIDCYLIYNTQVTNIGKTINFDLTNSSITPKSIQISSNFQNIRTWNSSGTVSQTIFNDFLNLSGFGTGTTNASIIGFGFKWSTSTGWVNSQALNLGFNLPFFSATTLNNNYPSILSYRLENSKSDSIFVFNANTYSALGNFVFRFDSGANGNASFDYAIFEYSTPNNSGNSSYINFSYRVDNSLDKLNSDRNFLNYSYDTNLGILPGESLGINKIGRYIDLIFSLNASSDLLAKPTLTSVSLYYSVFGQNLGIIYDTDVNSAPQIQYPRLKWSQGNSSNINITPVANDNTQSYQIGISNTSNIGQFIYLSNNQLKISDALFNEQNLVDSFNLYTSPYQVFDNLPSGLLNPQHFISNNVGGYFIADTDNDRVVQVDSNGELISAIQGNIKLPRSPRDFAVLGAYYNPSLKQVFVTFSQYIGFSNTSYINQISLLINGNTYLINDPTYFEQNQIGLWNANANNSSAIFSTIVTPALDTIINKNINDSFFQIQNTSINPPFILNPSGSNDGFPLENQTIFYDNSNFSEFSPNFNVGVGTILNFTNGIAITSSDPTVFGQNSGISPSTQLFSYTDINSSPPLSNFYSIPIQVIPIYFDNIFKPIFVDYTDSETLVVTTVGNNSIRAYNSSFSPSYVVPLSSFGFNEKLGGSSFVIDRNITQSGNNLLIAHPSNGIATISGNVSVFNRNTNVITNQFVYNGYDTVKALPFDNQYLVLLYDRQGNGLRSKLIRVGIDGKTNYALTNVFSKPVSLDIAENSNYYVTDTTGQIGTIFIRQFIADGAIGISSGTSSTIFGSSGGFSGPGGGGAKLG